MGRRGLLFCWTVWSCAQLGRGEEPAGQFCEGLDSCYNNTYTLEVYRGDSRSFILSLNENQQKLVTKCDPETKTWKEKILAAPGEAHFLEDNSTSISLVGGNFTVLRAEKTGEGLYKIEQLLHSNCLAVVNLTVLDLPLPTAATPSFDGSSTVTSNVTKTPEASSPGTDYTGCWIAGGISISAVGAVILLAVGFGVRKWIKYRRRPKGAPSEVGFEQLLNGQSCT